MSEGVRKFVGLAVTSCVFFFSLLSFGDVLHAETIPERAMKEGLTLLKTFTEM